MDRRHRASRACALIALIALTLALVPTGQAWACSCAEPTIDGLMEREPDVAIARIRRIDDGGSSGVGVVQEQLRGPQLPQQLPLALDDGGSCLPWVDVGDIAVLAFAPDGDGWRTLVCGLLSPSGGLGTVEPDPAATAPAAVVVAGRFPGADLIALDEQLRVLATGEMDDVRHGIQACGDDLVVPVSGPKGKLSIALVGVAGLAVAEEHLLTDDPDTGARILGLSCAGGTVDVLTGGWDASGATQLHRDVFGAGHRAQLPPAEDAGLAGPGARGGRPDRHRDR